MFLAAGSNQLRQYQRPETLFSQSPTGKCYPQKHFLRLGSKELLFSQCSAKAKRALLNKECRISLRSGEWEFSPGLCVIQAGLISSVPNYQFVKHLGVKVLIMQGLGSLGCQAEPLLSGAAEPPLLLSTNPDTTPDSWGNIRRTKQADEIIGVTWFRR